MKVLEFHNGPYSQQKRIPVSARHGESEKGSARLAGGSLITAGSFPHLDEQNREEISCFTGSY